MIRPKTIFLATKNQHKLTELKDLLSALIPDPPQLLSAFDVDPHGEVEESGDTFYENALIKARALRALVPEGSWVLADDSGLCVDALDGAPGVYSARYSGIQGDDAGHNQKLLKTLSQVSDRSASFLCCLVLLDSGGRPHEFYGQCHGRIATKASGANGFGYDPLFLVERFGKTMAELSPEEKASISHRGDAMRAFAQWLKFL